MRLLPTLSITFILIFCLSCSNNQQKKQEKKSFDTSNLLYTASSWEGVSDALGSSCKPDYIEVVDSVLNVDIVLKKKEAGEVVFAELICVLAYDIEGSKGVSINYKCTTPLLIKLYQSDFGHYGDQSYAHFECTIPPAKEFRKIDLDFSEFSRPRWTPQFSKGIPLKLENVDAIYLTPKINESTGGEASIAVRSLNLW